MHRWLTQCVAAASVLLCYGGAASASTLLSDFSDFALSGTYEQWNSGTFTSGPEDFRVQANDFGGGFFNLPAPVDASGEFALEVQLDVNEGNVAEMFNVVLFDGDGTERVFQFADVGVGDGQVLTKDLGDFLQDNNPGTTPGLDTTNLTVFHLQGTFANGNPGLAMDLTFDNLALVVPEPMAGALLAVGLAASAGAVRRRS